MGTATSAVAPLLRKHGFKKQRNAFNRETEPGLVQVIGFQMGRHMPPGTPEISGTRDDLYGAFTINVGLWFDEVVERAKPKAKFVREPDCHLRQRIGSLLTDPADTWWKLDIADDGLVTLANELISEYALPFLDQLDSREAVLAAWHRGDPALADHATLAPYVIAVLHAKRGETEAAEEIVASEIRNLGPGHPKVEGLLAAAAKLGLNVPPPS
jgi:hypothetical protein